MTRRSIEYAVALALALVLISGAAAATDKHDASEGESEPAAVSATVKVRKLNIRSGPGTQYRILRTSKRGEKLPILKIDDGWAKIDMEPAGWVLVRYIKMPEGFGLDPFVIREDGFIDWAVETEFLEEISLQDRGIIWITLTPEGYSRTGRPAEIARRLACGYREQTGFEGRTTVIVWPPSGPGETRVTAQGCDE